MGAVARAKLASEVNLFFEVIFIQVFFDNLEYMLVSSVITGAA